MNMFPQQLMLEVAERPRMGTLEEPENDTMDMSADMPIVIAIAHQVTAIHVYAQVFTLHFLANLLC